MISSSTNKTDLFTTPGTGPFPFTFKVDLATDLEVVKRAVSGVESTLTYITDYSVSLNADQESNPGGTYTLVAAITTGEKTRARRVVEATQGVDIQNAGGFSPEVVEGALDKLTALCQQNAEEVSRAVKVDLSSTETPDEMLARVEAAVADAEAMVAAADATLTTLVNDAVASIEALEVTAVSTYAKTLLDDVDAAAARATLGAMASGEDVLLAAGKRIVAEGATDDAFETTVGFVDPTADRAIDFPDNSGTVALTNDAATFAAAAAAARPFQSVISYTGASGVSAEGAAYDFSGSFPLDNTVPQITEGAPCLDVTITPSKVGAVIEVESVIQFGANGGAVYVLIAALFKDSDAGALKAAHYMSVASANDTGQVMLLHRHTAASLDPITFKVRVGAGGSTATQYVNRSSAISALLGQKGVSYVKATEVAYT